STRSAATQFPSVPGFTPMARPTSAIGRFSSRTIATASRRNSGENCDGRPLDTLFLLDMDSSFYMRCPSNWGIPNLADGATVSQAAATHGYSRPSFYLVADAFAQRGMAGLLDERPGRRGPLKLTEEIV